MSSFKYDSFKFHANIHFTSLLLFWPRIQAEYFTGKCGPGAQCDYAGNGIAMFPFPVLHKLEI